MVIAYAPNALAQSAPAATVHHFGSTLHVLMYGAIVGLAGYAFLLGVIRNSAAHLVCGSAIVSLALLSLASTNQPILTSSGSIAWLQAPRVAAGLLALSILACAQFARLALATADKHPGWNRALLAVMALALLAWVLSAANIAQAAVWLQRAAVFACCVAIAGAALASFTAGNRAALPLFIAANLVFLIVAASTVTVEQLPHVLSTLRLGEPFGVLAIALLLCATDAQRVMNTLSSMIATARRFKRSEKKLKALVLEQQSAVLETRAMLDDAHSARQRAELREKHAISRLAKAGGDDPATGVPNYTLFCRQAEVVLAHAQRHQRHVVIGAIEFDVDAGSHDPADLDHLMFVTAQRLRLSLRACDIVGRTGRAQVSIAVSDLATENDVALIVHKLGTELVEPVELGDRSEVALPRFGYAIFPTHQASVPELIKLAAGQAAYASVSLYEANTALATPSLHG